MQKVRTRIVDIAKKVGCTAATVSLVLNDSPIPSEKTRRKVKRVADQMGYVPNRMAQSLKRGRTFMLGVVMPFCGESYVSALLDSLSVEAAEYGYQLEIHFHRWSASEEDRILRLLSESRVEGIVFCGSRLDYTKVRSIAALAAQKIPIVSIGSRAGFTPQCLIEIGRANGAEELARYLGKLGHRRIDYIDPVLNRDAVEKPSPITSAILEGLKKGLRQFHADGHVSYMPTLIEHLQERKSIEHHGFSSKAADDILDMAVVNYFSSASQSTAVVASSITIAWKMLAEMQERGIRCPDDLSVACFGVDGTGALGAIPITAQEFSVEVMARKTISAMVAIIARPDSGKVIEIPMQLQVRKSCHIPCVKGNVVQAAG